MSAENERIVKGVSSSLADDVMLNILKTTTHRKMPEWKCSAASFFMT